MAKIAELNEEGWQEWVSTRPKVVQELCVKYPPDRLYRMQPTGHRVTIVAYGEDGTVRVNVSGEFNFVIFEREVFGIDPNDLEECDLPDENETLGVLLGTEEQVDSWLSYSLENVPN